MEEKEKEKNKIKVRSTMWGFFFGIMAILGEGKDEIYENHKAEILVSFKMGVDYR